MNKEKYADLHIHTDFSDGTFSPEKVVNVAIERGLSAIAICDHDCVDGIGPAIERARTTPLEIIPGVELTVIEKGKEIHLLGYFIAWKEKWFCDILKKVQRARIRRIEKMTEKLKAFDINIDKDRVIAIAGGKGSVGRLHMARALFESKAVPSIQAAFARYIGGSKPCYVEDIGFGAKEAIEIVLKAKGVPVLAHPVSLRDDSIIPQLVKYGLRGVEVYHSDHRASLSKKYEKIAQKFNLIITGGSDCHGMGKGRILMGSVKVGYNLVEILKREADSVKHGSE